MFMFAKVKQVAAVGAAVAGVGWVTVVSPAVAHTQPLRIPPGNDITCPGRDVVGQESVVCSHALRGGDWVWLA